MGDPAGNAALAAAVILFAIGVWVILWANRATTDDCPHCAFRGGLVLARATPEFWVFRCDRCDFVVYLEEL